MSCQLGLLHNPMRVSSVPFFLVWAPHSYSEVAELDTSQLKHGAPQAVWYQGSTSERGLSVFELELMR